MTDGVREITNILHELSRLGDLDPDEDFYEAGFSSLEALNLLICLESTYAVAIPDEAFVAARTPRALSDVISRLRVTD
jgi:acyl carrier protein